MDLYRIIDPQLARRAAAERWTIFTEWGDAPARFFYISGSLPGDCFQISIDPPEAEAIAITARSVDTDHGLEFEQTWRGTTAGFGDALELAIQRVEAWKRRET
ncbi:hypothetical protein ACIQC9_13070 [Brevundimonas sp. NPDC092305]|uniref:hypothetical protein n=1 Tax=Brevundimonas sp. NPDC092305 TaxID=3363957 RepID=UPI0037FB63F4